MLTDEQIEAVMKGSFPGTKASRAYRAFARAIEAAVLAASSDAPVAGSAAAYLDILACAVERATPGLGDSQAKLASAAAALRTPRALASAPAVPDGWVLVPKEPTNAMLEEFAGVRPSDQLSPSKQANEYAAYRRMLSAAPLHPQAGVGEKSYTKPCDHVGLWSDEDGQFNSYCRGCGARSQGSCQ